MSSRASRLQGHQESKTESKKSQSRLFLNYFDSFPTPSFNFLAPGAERVWHLICRLYLQLWAQRAQMTPVAGPGNPSPRKNHQVFTLRLWEGFTALLIGNQFLCVAWRESDFPRPSGNSLDFPEFPQKIPRNF